jgi:hypothetical protein
MSFHNRSLFEAGCDVIPLINGSDINGTTVTGDWIKLTNYNRVGILLCKFGSEDVDDTGLQFLQATDAAGSSSKALSLPANRAIHYKTGTLTAQTVWTKTSLSADADGLAFGSSVPSGFTRTIADVNTSPLMLYTELKAEDLDANNGFDWMTAYFGNNVNNACVVTVLAILMGGTYSGATPLSAIS